MDERTKEGTILLRDKWTARTAVETRCGGGGLGTGAFCVTLPLAFDDGEGKTSRQKRALDRVTPFLPERPQYRTEIRLPCRVCKNESNLLRKNEERNRQASVLLPPYLHKLRMPRRVNLRAFPLEDPPLVLVVPLERRLPPEHGPEDVPQAVDVELLGEALS